MGRGSSVVNQRVLARRLESCGHRFSSLEEVVEVLRTSYPDYRRIKQQPFSRLVQQTLQRLSTKDAKSPSPPPAFHFDAGDHPPGTSSRKRPRKVDLKEERLQRVEELHVRRRQLHNHSTSTSSGSDSESPSSADEGGDGAVSTSEDAIYEQKVEPEFDLMKSMLRDNYTKSSNSKSKLKEQIIEMEVASNKRDKDDIVNGVNGVEETLTAETRKEAKSSVSNVDVQIKGIEGPRFKDMGGMKEVIDELIMDVLVPLTNPHLIRWLGVRPMAGILLHGPPGCGKTTLAHAIANETGLPFYKISATEVVSGVSGASEENIRELFSKAYRTSPSIVFIDEIDAIASKRENLQREMERRIVTQLMTCMDDSNRLVQPSDKDINLENSDSICGYVLVIGATNRPDAVDPALRRPGRFDREIVLGVPDENARAQILSVLTGGLRLEGSFDIQRIARATSGFVGADLTALASKAGNLAMRRIIHQRKRDFLQDSVAEQHTTEWWKQKWLSEEMEKIMITMADFENAVTMIQPSLRREGFSTIPNIKWEDVGGLDALRKEFDRYIIRHIKFPEDYADLGVEFQTGFLLYGPPGCGKTLIAKAVAKEAGANFIHIKGPELLRKYVGESELEVRTLFSRARTCSPCILFFDEVDALTSKRGQEGGHAVERLLNQLLIELDGAEQRQGVFVVGATNRPEVMDDAILRPGRLGRLLYVPLPGPEERGLILKALSRSKPIDDSVQLSDIGRACENFSGADLAALMNEAALAALDEKLSSTESRSDKTHWTIKRNHFEEARRKISPSVSDRQKQYYQGLAKKYGAA